jgi:hypothetical protein
MEWHPTLINWGVRVEEGEGVARDDAEPFGNVQGSAE